MEIESLLTQWRSAESKLYPMVVVNPHQYEANLELVRAMTDDLSDVATTEDLVNAYENGSDLLAAAVARLGASAPRADIGPLLIDAAFQGRYRHLGGERQQAEAARRIAEAGKGPAWVLLAESGDDGPGAATGFRRIEMHLPDGLGVYSYIDIDPSTFLPLYWIETLQLDPATGEFTGNDARPERREFTDRAEWLDALAALKANADS
jgi:hypothetical protein